MKYLKIYEGEQRIKDYGDVDKLAINAIRSYIEELFFDDCLQFNYIEYEIVGTNVWFKIEFHSIVQNIVNRLNKLASFFGIEWILQHGKNRIVQYLIFEKKNLKKVADKLEMLAKSKKYNL